MYYTRLSYPEFVESINRAIDSAIEAGKKALTIDVPFELFDPLLTDIKIAGYSFTYPDDKWSDMHRVKISLV